MPGSSSPKLNSLNTVSFKCKCDWSLRCNNYSVTMDGAISSLAWECSEILLEELHDVVWEISWKNMELVVERLLYFWPIHPSIIYSHLSFAGSQGFGAYPSLLWTTGGEHLGQVVSLPQSWHLQPFTHTENLESPIDLPCMSMDCVRDLEHPGETISRQWIWPKIPPSC